LIFDDEFMQKAMIRIDELQQETIENTEDYFENLVKFRENGS